MKSAPNRDRVAGIEVRLTVEQVAAILNCSTAWVREQAASGVIAAEDISDPDSPRRRYRFRRSVVNAYLEARDVKTRIRLAARRAVADIA